MKLRHALLFITALSATSAFGQHQSYSAQHTRDIKALSAEEVNQYRAGAGMGYARAAELNRYPGPMHVLELAGPLALTPDQRARWLEHQVHFNTATARERGPELYTLLGEVCGEGSHVEAWIQKRWQGLRVLVEARHAAPEPNVVRRRRRVPPSSSSAPNSLANDG